MNPNLINLRTSLISVWGTNQLTGDFSRVKRDSSVTSHDSNMRYECILKI